MPSSAWLLLTAIYALGCGSARPAPARTSPDAAATHHTTPPAGETEPVGSGPVGDEADERADVPRLPSIECERLDPFGPIELTDEEYEGRYGADARNLARLPTSKQRPVETCGVDGQHDFLLGATCADGTHPFTDRAAVDDARRGNVGIGGRCDTIVDLYAVPCPEATYDVYIDMYFCPSGQGFQ